MSRNPEPDSPARVRLAQAVCRALGVAPNLMMIGRLLIVFDELAGPEPPPPRKELKA